jgi:hypothetical protein
MVKFVKEKNIDKFVCAAGILSHYVGDTCQPLHTSKYHAGLPENPSKVHGDFETGMIKRYAVEIVQGVNNKLAGTKVKPKVKGGNGAAVFTMKLMKK